MIRGPSAGPPGLGGGLLGAPPGAVASVGMGMSLGGLFGGQQPPLQSLFQQRPPASVNLSASTLAG
jgi:hypothetical protein